MDELTGNLRERLTARQGQFAGTEARINSIQGRPTTGTRDRRAHPVVNGDLTVPIDGTYEFHDAGRALKHFTALKRGRLAITVGRHTRD